MDIDRSDGSVSKTHGGNPRTSWLLGFIALTSLVILILAAILVANIKPDSVIQGGTRVVGPDQHVLGLPMMEQATWEAITKKAQTQELNFYLYSPPNSSSQIWVDQYLSEHMKEIFGVPIKRIDAVYSGCDLSPMAVVCDVNREVSQGKKTTGGSVDLIWINGVNFENMKKMNLLYGPFATLIPNAKNYDFANPRIAFDKGVAIAGMEFPFNGAQSVYLYNKANISEPPRTVANLITWIKDHPGQFAYADPAHDFTGACFIRNLFYYFCADNFPGAKRTDWLGPLNKAKYDQCVPELWRTLNEIEPAIAKNGTSYFSTSESVLELIGQGRTTLAFSFNIAEAAQRIKKGTWPSTMQAYVLTTGTIADTNYLAIPINAQNKEAALLTINHIASPHSLFQRSLPDIWGTLQVYNVHAPDIREWNVAFDHIDLEASIPTIEELDASALPDLPTQLVTQLNKDWASEVRDK